MTKAIKVSQAGLCKGKDNVVYPSCAVCDYNQIAVKPYLLTSALNQK